MLTGEGGNDRLEGGSGNDEIDGGEGKDLIKGGPGDDTIHAGPGDDTIYAEAGNDIIYGDAGNNLIDAGTGRDTIYAGEGQVHKYYLHDGGDSIHAGEGENFFYFFGATTNGPTAIDKLHMDDQIKFKNKCGKWQTAYVDKFASKFADLNGPWKVESADGVTMTVCKEAACTADATITLKHRKACV